MQAVKEILERTKLNAEMAEKVASGQWAVAGEEADGRRPTVDGEAANGLSSAIGGTLAQLLKRPEIRVEQVAPVLRELAPEFFQREAEQAGDFSPRADAPALLPTLIAAFRAESLKPAPGALPAEIRNELRAVETEIKYAGYLSQQQKSIERLKKAEQRTIPAWFDYAGVSGLSREMKEKLQKVRPQTLGQASGIPGVTPAAVGLIHVYIEIQARRERQKAEGKRQKEAELGRQHRYDQDSGIPAS